MFPHRALFALILGSLMVAAIFIIEGCGSAPAVPTSLPHLLPDTTPIVCYPDLSPSSTPVTPTAIWFLVDRSESMWDGNKCPHREQVYQLMRFFATIAKVVAEEKGEESPIYLAVKFFPGERGDISPTLASSLSLETIGETGKEHSDENQYRNALEKVWESVKRSSSSETIVVLLTDGTFAAGVEKEEQEDIKDYIANRFAKHPHVHTHVVLCGESQLGFWKELEQEGVKIYTASQILNEPGLLGEEILGEWLPKDRLIRTGWFSELPVSFFVPPEITEISKGILIPLRSTSAQFGLSDNTRPLRNFYRASTGLYYLQLPLSLENSSECTHQMTIEGDQDAAGFYIIRGDSGLSVTLLPGISINNLTSPLTISVSGLKVSPWCSTPTVVLEGGSAWWDDNSDTWGNKGVARWGWKPGEDREPPEITGTLLLTASRPEEVLLISCSISLPIRFQPQPTDGRNYSEQTVDGITIFQMTFPFKWDPSLQYPKIFLCSKSSPSDSINGTCATSADVSLECPLSNPECREECGAISPEYEYCTSFTPVTTEVWPSPHYPVIAIREGYSHI